MALRRILALSVALTTSAAMGCHSHAPRNDASWSPSAWGPGDAGPPASLEGSLMVGRRAIDLGIYLPSSPSAEDVAAAQETAKGRLTGVTLLTSPERADFPTALIFSPKIEVLPPPTLELIHSDGRGIKPGQAEVIAASKGLIAMVARLDDDPTLARLHDVQIIALDIARANGGAIWEEATREVYSVDEWQKVRLEGWEEDRPEVRRHISLHYDDSRGRLVTLGMEKFGLPDLMATGVPPNEVGSAVRVLDGVAQLLVDGAKVERGGLLQFNLGAVKNQAARLTFLATSGPSVRNLSTVTLVAVPSEPGDPENRLVEVHLPSPPADAGAPEKGEGGGAR